MPEVVRASGVRAARLATSPVVLAVILAFALVAVLIAVTGESPWVAYSEMWRGATTGAGPRSVVSRLVPIVGMALVVSIPLRAGIINLGGEGQMVVGGLAGALVAIHAPGPGPVVIVVAFAAGALAGSLWASVPALGQVGLGLPILISSLLLNAPGRAVTGYLVRNVFADPTSTSAATVAVPAHARIPKPDLFGGATASIVLVLALVALIAMVNSRTRPGYETRMSGLNLRFSRYGGVQTARQTLGVMLAAGGIAGMIGTHLVLGEANRFVDGDLVGTGYAWTGLLVSLLAGNAAIAILAAGLFFAALQVGGLAMQRTAGVSWQLAQVLQAVVILALAVRLTALGGRRPSGVEPDAAAPPPHSAEHDVAPRDHHHDHESVVR